jgi:hypothetical protein
MENNPSEKRPSIVKLLTHVTACACRFGSSWLWLHAAFVPRLNGTLRPRPGHLTMATRTTFNGRAVVHRLAAAIFAIAALEVGQANAHDSWASGDPIPGWVKSQCCGPSDAHHLNPSQVHVTPTGYRVDGYYAVIPESRLLPSPDGDWWVFYRDKANGNQGPAYCFFGPAQRS